MHPELQEQESALARRMTQTLSAHALLEAGDHVLCALSGGKDSYTLLHLLLRAQKRAPFPFTVTAVHVDQGQPGYDGKPLEGWLQQQQVPHHIVHEDTYSIVVERTPPGGTYCRVCSRLRRGILTATARTLGCNKIALGHHLDDALETLLLNLFFAGSLRAMPPRYRTQDGQLDIIRPLIEIPEAQIARFARLADFPILPCRLCGSQEGLQRDEMKRLLDTLEQSHPNVRSVMGNALRNVAPSHLHDPRLKSVPEPLPRAAGPLALHPSALPDEAY